MSGLRGQVIAGFVVLLTLATVAVSTVERQILLDRLEQRVAAELRQEVDELRRLVGGEAPDGSCIAGEEPDGGCTVGRNPETGQPFGDDVEAVFDTFLRRSIPGEHETMVTFVGGAFHAGSIDDPAVQLEQVPAFVERVARTPVALEGTVGTSRGEVAYLAIPLGGDATDPAGVFAVAQFLQPQRSLVLEGLSVVIIANAVLLVLASALAAVALNRLLRPVRLVTEAATAISESDLSRRIPVAGGADDEASLLATTFNAMLDRLEAAFATQRDFLDDAAHELRTPITIVRGNLELLPDDPEGRAAAVAVATEELDRMSRFVEDLLTLAKAERPDFLHLAPVDLAELVDGAAVRARALGDRRWALVADARTTVLQADGQRLTQAVLQLVENAVQHTAPGGRIEIGYRVDDGRAEVWVADDGPGIPEEDRERVFGRFARGGARTQGSGLGLSIVAAIARAHGGSARIGDAPGGGTTVTLALPTS